MKFGLSVASRIIECFLRGGIAPSTNRCQHPGSRVFPGRNLGSCIIALKILDEVTTILSQRTKEDCFAASLEK